MCINLLRLMLYLLLLSNLFGCQVTPPIYGIPVPDLQQLTEAQKKALSEDYYLIPKKSSSSTDPSPGFWYDDRAYNNWYWWNTNRVWQQNEYARQHAIEEQHRAWEASEAREQEQRQATTPSPPPPSPAPPSTSTQCSADTPCKQFKLR